MRVSDMYNSIKDLLEVNVISEKYNRDLLENTKHIIMTPNLKSSKSSKITFVGLANRSKFRFRVLIV